MFGAGGAMRCARRSQPVLLHARVKARLPARWAENSRRLYPMNLTYAFWHIDMPA